MLYKRLLVALFLFCCVPLTSIAASPHEAAPDFSIQHGTLPANMSGLKGKVVYLDFWASWCKPCRKSFPWMNKMQQKYAQQGFQIIAVNLDTEAELAAQFLSKVPAEVAVIYDPSGEIAQRYEIIGMPSSYLIDAKGVIRSAHKGFFTAKQDLYEQQIVSLLSERE